MAVPNMELSCAAASAQHRIKFKSACTAPSGLQGDNCSDLSGGLNFPPSAAGNQQHQKYALANPPLSEIFHLE
jgi:hypothetical protein